MTTFSTTLWASGGNNVGIIVPEEVVLSFGRGRRVPVRVTIDGVYSYRTTIASMGGKYLISFNSETRAATGRAAGDEVEVALELDDAPREVDVPVELAAALERDPIAAAAWEKLSYSKKKAYALSVSGAKAPETKQRRLEKALGELKVGA